MLTPYAALQALFFLERDASDILFADFIHEALTDMD